MPSPSCVARGLRSAPGVSRTPDLQVRSLTAVGTQPISHHLSTVRTRLTVSGRGCEMGCDGLGAGTVRAQSATVSRTRARELFVRTVPSPLPRLGAWNRGSCVSRAGSGKRVQTTVVRRLCGVWPGNPGDVGRPRRRALALPAEWVKELRHVSGGDRVVFDPIAVGPTVVR